MLFNFLTQGCERLFIFYILTFCIQKFNSLKLAPEPPKGDKMEKDGGSGGRCEPHGQWWEVVGVVGAVGAARAMMGGGVGAGGAVRGRGSGGNGGR